MSLTSDLTNRRGRWRARLGRPLIASATALSLVAIAGCGDEEPTSQASTPAPPAATSPATPAEIRKNAKKPGKRTLAWASDVCEAWGSGAAEVSAPDPKDKAAVKQYFEDVAELYGDKQAALEKIGPPPVGGDKGEATWDGLVGMLSTLQKGVTSTAKNPPKGSSLNAQVAVIQRTRGPIPSLRLDRTLVLAFDQDSCKNIAN